MKLKLDLFGTAFLMVLGANALCMIPDSHAAGGTSGGGGAKIESAFRLRAYDLISKIETSRAAESLCSSKTMQDALEGSRIRVVRTLVNAATNQPILDRQLDAWTTPLDPQQKRPGDIQLMPSWERYLDAAYPSAADKPSIDTLILHEVYRATGTCDDESFKISEQILKLLNQPARFSQIFKFSYSDQLSILNERDGYQIRDYFEKSERGVVACDQPLGVDGQWRTCVHVDGGILGVYQAYTATDYILGYGVAKRALVIHKTLLTGVPNNLAADNFVQMASVEHPLYVVYDYQTGELAYGTDLAKLLPM